MTSLTEVRGIHEKLPIDISEEQDSFLLIGKNGGHIRISPSARQLLQMVSSGLSFEAMAERLRSRTGKVFSPGELETAYCQILNRIEEIDRNASRDVLPASFWLRKRIFPSVAVEALARRLSIAFHPVLAALFLAAVIASITLLRVKNSSLGFTTQSFWPGYALFLLSILVHEFGHASACARYGAAPSDIGFTIYLIYPAFYSDVTSAWQLKRWQRVIVDLGGNYFQYLTGAVYISIYLASGEEMFRSAFLMILYTSAFSLNPIFKFDGYWVLADALGVTNLGQQPIRLLKHAVYKLMGRPIKPLPWPVPVIAMLAVYTPLSLAFWAYFLWQLLPSLWYRTLQIPGHLTEAFGFMMRGDSTAWLHLRQLGLSTFFLVIAYVMFFRMLHATWGKLRQKLSSRPSSLALISEPQTKEHVSP